MAKLSDITQPNWTLSLFNQGEIVEGVDEISQCILVTVLTVVGSDPLRPTFGTPLLLLIDRPVNEVLPKMIKAIVDGINTWEPRVDIKTVSYNVQMGSIDFIIDWKEKVSDQPGTTKITVNGTN